MKTMTAKLIASVLIISFLIFPADLSAKDRRGANLVVTRLDGSQVSGELLAVRQNSLLLLNNVGRDESIDLADIKTVRIVRKSFAGKGALYGFLAGVLSAGVFIFSGAGSEMSEPAHRWDSFLLMGGVAGVLGALSGLIAGSVAGRDSSFTVAGQSEAVVSTYWDRLRAHARVPAPTGALPFLTVNEGWPFWGLRFGLRI